MWTRTVVGAVVGLLFLLTSRGEMAPPNPVARGKKVAHSEEVYIPQAGFVRTVQRSWLQRRNTLGELKGAPTVRTVLQGDRSFPVVCVEYTDVRGPFPAADYQKLLFDDLSTPSSGDRTTLTQYYRDVSLGRLNVTGKVLGWYPLPQKAEYYRRGQADHNKRFGELLRSALEKADAEIDLGLYDNDGPDGVPNSGDDDGKVDCVFLIHPEAGAETGHESTANNIHSHAHFYSAPRWGHGAPFRTRAISRDRTGAARLDNEGNPKPVVVDDYIIQPALRTPAEDGVPGQMIQIGVFCHEFGHALGLPDLYDRTPDGEPDSHGVGNWCLMAHGCNGGDGNHADCPVHLSAWCKLYLGWASVETINRTGRVTFEPVSEHNRIFRINVPGSDGKEYFLIEFRDPAWREGSNARRNWDRHLPGAGLAIWHVDESVGMDSTFWPLTSPDQGQNDAPSRPTSESHSLVALRQCDRKLALEFGLNFGTAAHLFRNNDEFKDDPEMKGGSRSYKKQPTGIRVSNINLTDRSMKIEFATEVVSEKKIDLGPMASPPKAKAKAMASLGPKVPALIPKESAAVASIQNKINLRVPVTLNDDEKKVIRSLSPVQIERIFSAADAAGIKQVAAEARTKVIRPTMAAGTPLEHEVLKVLGQSTNKEVTVQADPTDKWAYQVTGLALARNGRTQQEDAQFHLNTTLKPLMSAAALRPAPGGGSGPSRFEQVFKVGSEDLPIFERDTVLYYSKDGHLTGFVCRTAAPAQLKVSADPTPYTEAQARQRAVRRLGVSEKVITGVRKGIYLVDGLPANGRVSYQVTLGGGGKRDDMLVYVDAATGEILDIN